MIHHFVIAAILAFLASPAGADIEKGPPTYIDCLGARLLGDDVTALHICRAAAEQGDSRAQTTLGSWYETGLWVPQDAWEAYRWYLKAADQGHTDAQYRLGMMLLGGKGIGANEPMAAIWLRKAAEQGRGEAQFMLGAMYHVGKGVPQDHVLAHMWYNLAAAQFHKFDETAREARDRLAEAMMPEQLAEAQRLAREWKPKSE